MNWPNRCEFGSDDPFYFQKHLLLPHDFKCSHCRNFAATSDRKLLEHVNLKHADRKESLELAPNCFNLGF